MFLFSRQTDPYVTSRDVTSPLCSVGVLIGWFCPRWRGSSSRIVGLSNRNELAKSSELHFIHK